MLKDWDDPHRTGTSACGRELIPRTAWGLAMLVVETLGLVFVLLSLAAMVSDGRRDARR
jgi:hypothetical protein